MLNLKSKSVLFLMAAAVLTLNVSCQKDGHKTRIVGGKGGNQQNNEKLQEKVKACDLSDAKCLEKDLVDISELAAYKAYILPAFEKYDSELKELTKSNKVLFTEIYKSKKWYFLKQEIQSSDKTLSEVKIRDNKKTLSSQTQEAIFIAKEAFDSRENQAQANIIANEIATLMYLVGSNKKLESKDRENISKIRMTLVDEGKKISLKEFYSKLVESGYNKNIFGEDVAKAMTAEKKNSDSEEKSNNTDKSKESNCGKEAEKQSEKKDDKKNNSQASKNDENLDVKKIETDDIEIKSSMEDELSESIDLYCE